MEDYQPIDLSALCNVGLELLTGYRRPPVGDEVFHGLPFQIGNPGNAAAPCFVVLAPGQDVLVPVGSIADHIIVAHRRPPFPEG